MQHLMLILLRYYGIKMIVEGNIIDQYWAVIFINTVVILMVHALLRICSVLWKTASQSTESAYSKI